MILKFTSPFTRGLVSQLLVSKRNALEFRRSLNFKDFSTEMSLITALLIN